MGATGLAANKNRRAKKESELNTDTFGIKGAVVYRGKVPPNSDLKQPSGSYITLKIAQPGKDNIIFQFKLTRDRKLMNITGFKDGIPQVKCKVSVDSGNPSLNRVIASGSSSERAAAIKMKDLMSKSADVSEDQLGAIANKLLAHKKRGE